MNPLLPLSHKTTSFLPLINTGSARLYHCGRKWNEISHIGLVGSNYPNLVRKETSPVFLSQEKPFLYLLYHSRICYASAHSPTCICLHNLRLQLTKSAITSTSKSSVHCSSWHLRSWLKILHFSPLIINVFESETLYFAPLTLLNSWTSVCLAFITLPQKATLLFAWLPLSCCGVDIWAYVFIYPSGVCI